MHSPRMSSPSVLIDCAYTRFLRTMMALLALCFISGAAMGTPIIFTDDFNRPDGPVGNGWSNTIGNTGGNLGIRSGALSTPGPDGRAGIYRPIDLSATVTVSGTLTQSNGFGGLLNRYDTSFLFGDASSPLSGYGVYFSRSDQNFANSTVNLMLNGGILESVPSSFQFGASITPTFTFNPDRSIAGSVAGSGNTFNFSFGPRSVTLPGSNFDITVGFPDGRSSVITNPTLDNLSLSYGDAPPPPTPTPFGPVDVPSPISGDFNSNAKGYTLSLDESRFLVDFPIYLNTALAGSSVDTFVDSLISGINKTWSSVDVKDQYGTKYDFDFKAHLEDDQSKSFSTIHLSGLTGSNFPPCRPTIGSPPPDCVGVPLVANNTMEMFTGNQSFCYVDPKASSRVLLSCDANPPVSGKTLIPCVNPDGSPFLDKGKSIMCYDTGAVQPLIAAHEFGHLLGLPDEYGQRPKNILCDRYGLDASKCVDGGLMEALNLPPVERYFDVLFLNLDDFTPDFKWTFGLAPGWESDVPPELVDILDTFELPAQISSEAVPEPSTAALLALGALAFGVTRRYRRTEVDRHEEVWITELDT